MKFPCFPLLVLLVSCQLADTHSSAGPRVLDPDLSLELIAELPTPIGLAIDSLDRIYVLESHTHLPPKNYPGPRYDRVMVGQNPDKQGIPQGWAVFADSIEDGMNMAFGKEGELLVVEKNRVRSFGDLNGDGKCDRTRILLSMSPPENVYDHAGLLGIAVSEQGDLYISRGNTGSQYWRLTGTDGTFVEGYGDGGNVIRCKEDGAQLEEVATGFWNPFDLKFSAEGRLMLVDNDPDSRGPNRLLEVIAQGDYGYKSLYGGSGIHPFAAWNGELPETLPYAAALGEAPSGLLDLSFSQFPPSYSGAMLCTIWEENNVVHIPLTSRGITVKGEAKVLVQGGSSFHPVALAANSKGEVFMTDWVKRQYPNHGSGRLWRIRTKEAGGTPLAHTDKRKILSQPELKTQEDVLTAFQTSDAHLHTLARHKMWTLFANTELEELLLSANPSYRLQTLLAFGQKEQYLEKAFLDKLLKDEVETIRLATLRYIARNGRADMYSSLEGCLEEANLSLEFMESYLETIRHLQAPFIQQVKDKSERLSNKIARPLPEGYALAQLSDTSVSPSVQQAVLPFVSDWEENLSSWKRIFESAGKDLKQSLLRTIEHANEAEVAPTLLTILEDEQAHPDVRTQAILSLEYQPDRYCEAVASTLTTAPERMASTAIKYLCGCSSQLAQLTTFLESKATPAQQAIWALCQGEGLEGYPETDSDWEKLLEHPGDAQAGRWVFQSPQTQCQLCHTVDGWGGSLGPDLSHIGASKSQSALLSSILTPSAQMSPEWQGWFVESPDGSRYLGRQIDVGTKYVELMLPNGEFQSFPKPVVFGVATTSLMPEGLEKNLTPMEFRDLIAYLESLK